MNLIVHMKIENFQTNRQLSFITWTAINLFYVTGTIEKQLFRNKILFKLSESKEIN